MAKLVQEASRKAARRLMPFIVVLYFMAFLDRVNIGFAALTMNADLKLSATEFGFASGVFFVSYVLFEVPSNIIGTRFGVPRWLARIMVSWGLASMATAFVAGPHSLYVVRFLLGLAEAGFFPAIVIYLTAWFPANDRGKIFGLLQAAAPLSSVIGAPLSALVLTHLNGFGGLAGWKWLFLTQGAPSIVLGIICLFYLPLSPEKAGWLEPQERQALQAQLDRERREKEGVRKYTLLEGLTNPRILVLAFLFFFVILGMNGVAFWTPQIMGSFGFGTLTVGLLTATPSLCGAIAMIFWSRHSDATGERVWHLILPMLVASAGFFAAATALTNPAIAVIALCIATIGLWCTISVWWTWPTSALTGVAAAAGVALINSVAQLSGLVGPWAIGWTKDLTGGFGLAMSGLGAGFIIAACVGYLWARGVPTLRGLAAQPHPVQRAQDG